MNLVPNEGFENDTSCPYSEGSIHMASPWFQPCTWQGNTTNSSNSDLFDACAFCCRIGIPLNLYGNQTARTGHSYAGICFYYDNYNYREYIEVPLISQLFANKRYCIQFYVSLADSSQVAISNFGTYFSVDSLLDNRYFELTIDYVTPQFENPVTNMLTDKNNWMLVSGSFIAAGGEKFMTLGNFHLQANTNAQSVAGGTQPYAYYYIDDVSVIDCTNQGVEELTNSQEIILFPNPATSTLTLEIKDNINNNLPSNIIITDVLGETVYKQSAQINNQSTINITQLSKGIYFLEVQTEKGITRKKFVKQ